MNFCVAIVILKMGENNQHFGILCFIISRKVKVQQKCKKKICAVCGEGAVTGQMCQKRFAKFRAGDCSLDDAPLLGRLVEADSDQIETLIENNQCYPTWEIANILKISKSIKLLVKMKKNCLLLYRKNETDPLANPILMIITLADIY